MVCEDCAKGTRRLEPKFGLFWQMNDLTGEEYNLLQKSTTVIALLPFPAVTQNDYKEKSKVQHSRNISNDYHNHSFLKLCRSIKIIFNTIFFKIKGSIKRAFTLGDGLL